MTTDAPPGRQQNVALGGSCTSRAGDSAGFAAGVMRRPAPDVELRDAKNATLRVSDYRGRVLLLDFWATWCTGCKLEIPWYMEFQEKYQNQGLDSLGVAMDAEGWQKVTP